MKKYIFLALWQKAQYINIYTFIFYKYKLFTIQLNSTNILYNIALLN